MVGSLQKLEKLRFHFNGFFMKDDTFFKKFFGKICRLQHLRELYIDSDVSCK